MPEKWTSGSFFFFAHFLLRSIYSENTNSVPAGAAAYSVCGKACVLSHLRMTYSLSNLNYSMIQWLVKQDSASLENSAKAFIFLPLYSLCSLSSLNYTLAV